MGTHEIFRKALQLIQQRKLKPEKESIKQKETPTKESAAKKRIPTPPTISKKEK